MPTTTTTRRIRPSTGVSVVAPASSENVVVGSGLQLSDDSDDTYVQGYFSLEGGDVWVEMPTEDVTGWVGLAIAVRLMRLEPNGGFAVNFASTATLPPPGEWFPLGASIPASSVPTGSPGWVSRPVLSGVDIAAELIGAGNLVLQFGLTGAGARMRVFEVALDFTIALPEPPPGLPPARLFPRDDGLGMSAGTRVHPPPKSQQGGPRVGPGSYW